MSRRRSMEKIMESDYVTISELVRLSEMRYSTLKYYTEQGILPFDQEDTRLTRRYPRISSLERLALIRQLKERGYTIEEIKEQMQKS
ncbi:helix-turn-helix domain-containing protein [Priestia abyssalis]|uniref:helix-turn-helix domain-containing protein n=1 Tax=Priestia abyssalis TaxID=1221450 RepID=UPI00099519F8|nr:helix-turn-helix domain-containing protein [Priestia abyssalis]